MMRYDYDENCRADFGMDERSFNKMFLLGFDDPYNEGGSIQKAKQYQAYLDQVAELSQKERDRNRRTETSGKLTIWQKLKDWWRGVWKR